MIEVQLQYISSSQLYFLYLFPIQESRVTKEFLYSKEANKCEIFYQIMTNKTMFSQNTSYSSGNYGEYGRIEGSSRLFAAKLMNNFLYQRVPTLTVHSTKNAVFKLRGLHYNGWRPF